MPDLIYLPVRAEILDALRPLADGVGSVATRDHGELTSELLMVAGRELVWLTVEPHARAHDLSVEQLDALTLAGAELLAAAITHLAPRPAAPACPAAEVPSLGPSDSAGAEWRNPGCSMCLAMNPDQLKPQERCASTSNRNFEGRQGKGGRTHLVGPEMAAAAAIAGHFVDIRKWS